MKKLYVALIVLSIVTAGFLLSTSITGKMIIEKGDNFYTDTHDIWPGPDRK